MISFIVRRVSKLESLWQRFQRVLDRHGERLDRLDFLIANLPSQAAAGFHVGASLVPCKPGGTIPAATLSGSTVIPASAVTCTLYEPSSGSSSMAPGARTIEVVNMYTTEAVPSGTITLWVEPWGSYYRAIVWDCPSS